VYVRLDGQVIFVKSQNVHHGDTILLAANVNVPLFTSKETFVKKPHAMLTFLLFIRILSLGCQAANAAPHCGQESCVTRVPVASLAMKELLQALLKSFKILLLG
jgi:hypothetical protein